MSAITYTWDGDALIPLPMHKRQCDKELVVGEQYTLEARRSQISHSHQFAWIDDAWRTLPERFKHEPWAQSPEHLRKFCLIRSGFCDTQTYPCGSHAEAMRWAANLRPLDEYSIVVVEGATVQRFTAQSQSRRSMGARRFQESKTAVLDYIAELLGVEPETLEANAGKAA